MWPHLPCTRDMSYVNTIAVDGPPSLPCSAPVSMGTLDEVPLTLSFTISLFSHGFAPPLSSLLPPSDHHGAGECGHPGRGNQGPHVRPQGRKPAQDEADLPCGAAHHAGRGAGKRMGAAGGVGNPFRARFQEIYRTVLRTMWDVVQVRVSRRDEPLLLPCDLRHAYSSHMFTCTSQGISSLH